MKAFGSCTVKSSTLRGVESMPVDVEVVVSRGMPSFNIVGMGDIAIQEAKERIRAAIVSSGFTMPSEKVVVNLAPGYVKKSGTGFDLPVAAGILAATGQIPRRWIDTSLMVGELSLDGSVKAVRGLLSHGQCARELDAVLVSGEPEDGFMGDESLRTAMLRSLRDLLSDELPPFAPSCEASESGSRDFRDIAGHETAKRGLQIAAVGQHGLLMVGPPGSGKTMLASCLPTILPPLTEEEVIECAMVYSVAGEGFSGVGRRLRPFRAPHHSASMAGLIGGGNPIRPGEVSLAHNGVLFLDELAEFKPSVLQALRQPIESGWLNLIRADGQVKFPARFTLIAACNPCPCGYLGDPDRKCTCSQARIEQYRSRVGGPLYDRFDMQVSVPRLTPQQVLDSGVGKSSEQMKAEVDEALEFSSWRKSRSGDCDPGRSAEKEISGLMRACDFTEQTNDKFQNVAALYHLSGRGIKRTLGLARTIADLERCQRVEWVHLAEALQFRTGDSIG